MLEKPCQEVFKLMDQLHAFFWQPGMDRRQLVKDFCWRQDVFQQVSDCIGVMNIWFGGIALVMGGLGGFGTGPHG